MNLLPIGPNQTEIATGKRRVFFSYSTPVAAIMDGVGVRSSTRHSNTTARHVNAWLRANGYGDSAITKPQAWFDSLKGAA